MKNNLFDLSGQIAVITGGGKGLGQAMALGLADAGATVIIVGRTLDPLMETTNRIVEKGGAAEFHQMDVRNEQAVQDLASRVIERHGRIDVLVNNVGMAPTQPALEISKAEWDQVMDTNLGSLFTISRTVGAYMVKARKGNIINIASVLGKMAGMGAAHYCASKAAIIHTTKALALEWARFNIRVNCIAPGFFKTDMTRDQQEDAAQQKFLMRKIPFGRMGEPEEITGAAVFLASRASTYMTGATLFVDGGYSVW